ncbi:uncharacterized protein BXZ73DRAFT_79496 [Epithele typhae]|uniref:uncharacterized protein n=1 Tax=Epithele typhae TaxID=378194 RepID=UPI002008496C|nr:uncharacterized protein BXZ73DRAFT_79496 [Epithele typhae]KAH9923431.1 hypothetical protein BXZ73DRAFT_79496 [Epithele typhae]
MQAFTAIPLLVDPLDLPPRPNLDDSDDTCRTGLVLDIPADLEFTFDDFDFNFDISLPDLTYNPASPMSPLSSDGSDLESVLASPSTIYQSSPLGVVDDPAVFDHCSFLDDFNYAQFQEVEYAGSSPFPILHPSFGVSMPDGLESSCARQAPTACMVPRGPSQGVDMNDAMFVSMDPSPPPPQVALPTPIPVNKRKEAEDVAGVDDTDPSPRKRPRRSSSKEFPCEDCHLVFDRRSNMTTHVNDCHKNLRPFPCTVCPYRSKRKSDLGRHFQSYHTNKGSPRRKTKE